MFLSAGQTPVESVIQESYAGARPFTSPDIDRLGAQIQGYLIGQPVVFDLNMMALEDLGEFARRVLTAEYGIPRGWVSTYGRIAKHVGAAGASRAVGGALARNRFPIVIPCHRAVRSDGHIGGYQGGGKMKRALLTMEGVKFTATGAVSMDKVYY